MNLVVMGVSGSGKSTVGKALAQALNLPFYDGDDFHPRPNVEKMAAGKALNDEDRKPWLECLAQLIDKQDGLVLACSALKKEYRESLDKGGSIIWIYLEGTFDQIQERLKSRKGHYMPIQLLESQFDALQVPENAIIANISKSPKEIVSSILEKITY